MQSAGIIWAPLVGGFFFIAGPLSVWMAFFSVGYQYSGCIQPLFWSRNIASVGIWPDQTRNSRREEGRFALRRSELSPFRSPCVRVASRGVEFLGSKITLTDNSELILKMSRTDFLNVGLSRDVDGMREVEPRQSAAARQVCCFGKIHVLRWFRQKVEGPVKIHTSYHKQNRYRRGRISYAGKQHETRQSWRGKSQRDIFVSRNLNAAKRR